MGALALFLFGIVTHHVATAAFAFAHDHFLDAQVVRHLLVTTWALEHLLGHLVTTAHRHTQDVFPPTLTELLEVVLGHHPGIAHKHTTAQFPPAQIVFHLGHGADIHRVARKHPVPHRQAIARHSKPNDVLRSIGATVFRQAAFARCP